MEKKTPLCIAATCAHIMNDRKATGITVLNIEPVCSIADYFVIGTGRSERQLKAIAAQIEKMAHENSVFVMGIEGKGKGTGMSTGAGNWILVDLCDVVVHLFDDETRNLYDLELLWGDTERADWQGIKPLAFSDFSYASEESSISG